MPEWLKDSITFHAISPGMLAGRLLLALAFGGFVALAYRVSHGRETEDSRILVTTLVLLSVLIAMVSMVIGDNVARAFSLVGALSIVRFRTVVDDTRDTAFVIFAVIVGMAIGAGLMWIPMIGVPIVSLAAVALSWRGNQIPSTSLDDCTLTVRIGIGRNPDAVISDTLTRYVESSRMIAASTAKQGAALEVTYLVHLKEAAAMPSLVAELNKLEGMQSVEIRSP